MTKPRWEPVRYRVDTDTMAIELRPWPGGPDEPGEGEDAGPDLVIHYHPGDGEPWLWEIEHASRHPEHISAALSEMRRLQPGSHEGLHTITSAKTVADGSFELSIHFDGGFAVVDLAPLLAQGGVFEPLRDPKRFAAVHVAPDGHSLVWRVSDAEGDIVDLSADALWFMAHPEGHTLPPATQ